MARRRRRRPAQWPHVSAPPELVLPSCCCLMCLPGCLRSRCAGRAAALAIFHLEIAYLELGLCPPIHPRPRSAPPLSVAPHLAAATAGGGQLEGHGRAFRHCRYCAGPEVRPGRSRAAAESGGGGQGGSGRWAGGRVWELGEGRRVKGRWRVGHGRGPSARAQAWMWNAEWLGAGGQDSWGAAGQRLGTPAARL